MKKLSGKILILIILMVAALIIGAVYFLICLYLYDDNEHKITRLSLSQEDFTIHATWDETDCTGYRLFIIHGTERPEEVDVESNGYDVENVEIGSTYKVIVSAISEDGTASGAADSSIETSKVTQTIKGLEDTYYGFEGDNLSLTAEAYGDVEYSSEDANIASVDEMGNISFNKAGKVSIHVNAPGDEQYEDAAETVSVTVYPDKLDAVEVSVQVPSQTEAKVSWNRIEFATGYEILKKNPANGDFEVISELGADAYSIVLAREQAAYKVRGIISLGEKRVEGELSQPVEVKSAGEEAKTYSSKHILRKFGVSDLDKVSMIRRSGSINVPQSMCFNGSEYIVTFIDHSNGKAAMQSYDRNGKLISTQNATGVDHANGSTCNPNTGTIYTVKTSGNVKSQSFECLTFDDKTLHKKGSVRLPKSTSGIAYDSTNDKYYLSRGGIVYVCDSNFNVEKSLKKKTPYKHSQDIGGYNGIVFSCTWISGKKSFIDMHRISDGGYLGSFDVSVGEIESCFVDDGYLVILINTIGSRNEYIYKTKERISF